MSRGGPAPVLVVATTSGPASEHDVCPLCADHGDVVECATVLGRHEGTLIRCVRCRTCWFRRPGWLAEAYETTLTSGDIGLISRNTFVLKAIVLYLRLCRPGFREPILDFGAGTGILVRSLRDAGNDARYFDHYGGNHFAKGHEATLRDSYGLATAVEVMEHVVELEKTLHELLSWSTELLFTTTLIDPDTPALNAWPYYGLDHGQHVLFMTRQGLERYARSRGMWFATSGELHLLTPSRRRARLFVAAMGIHALRVRLRFRSRRSLLWTDVAAHAQSQTTATGVDSPAAVSVP